MRIALPIPCVFILLTVAGAQVMDVKVRVNLVATDAIVRSNEKPLGGELQVEDFAVYDDGVAQQVTYFSRDRIPLAVALVVDTSTSIESYFQQLRTAAISALSRLKPEDQVVLFSFSVCPVRHTDLTTDRAQIAARISELQSRGGTNIHGAIFEAARYLQEKAPGSRRAIILVSDNAPNIFQIKESEVLRKLQETSATLYGIRTPGENPGGEGSANQQNGPEAIERVANDSGGEVLSPTRVADLGEALDTAISNLRAAYTLGFTPSQLGEEGSYHKLAVNIVPGRCPDCRVQARTGYYVGRRALPPSSHPDAIQPYDCAQLFAYHLMRNVYASASEVRDLPFKAVVTEGPPRESQGSIRVALRLDAGKIGVTMEAGHPRRALLIAILCRDEAGKTLEEHWHPVSQDRLSQPAFDFSALIPANPAARSLKIGVYDLTSHNLGIKVVRLGK